MKLTSYLIQQYKADHPVTFTMTRLNVSILCCQGYMKQFNSYLQFGKQYQKFEFENCGLAAHNLTQINKTKIVFISFNQILN